MITRVLPKTCFITAHPNHQFIISQVGISMNWMSLFCSIYNYYKSRLQIPVSFILINFINDPKYFRTFSTNSSRDGRKWLAGWPTWRTLVNRTDRTHGGRVLYHRPLQPSGLSLGNRCAENGLSSHDWNHEEDVVGWTLLCTPMLTITSFVSEHWCVIMTSFTKFVQTKSISFFFVIH